MNSFRAALMALGMGSAVAGAATLESVAADGTTAPPSVVASTPSASPTPSAASTTASGAPQATSFGALDYFQTSCARCHGDYGSFYGPTFGQKLDDTQMQTVVHDMAYGPAQAPINDKNMDVLVAWHRLLRDHKPFISVVKAETSGKGWTLSGEVSPGATLQLNGVAVKTQGHTWTAVGVPKGPLQLQAKMGDKTTTLDALKAAYSG